MVMFPEQICKGPCKHSVRWKWTWFWSCQWWYV